MSDFSITDVNAITNSLTASAANAKADALADKIKNTSPETTEEELMEACKGFEAYFIEQVLKEMEKTVDIFKGDSEDNSMSMYRDFMKDTYLQNMAEQIADQGSLGIAQQLYENMKNNYHLNIKEPEAENAAADTVSADAANPGNTQAAPL